MSIRLLVGVCQLSHPAVRHLSTTTSLCAGGKWRLKHGMDACGNQYGPLAEIPDWSYSDGRPAPLSEGEVARRQRMQQLGETIVQLTKEMNFAKENHALRTQRGAEETERILRAKLRAKQD